MKKITRKQDKHINKTFKIIVKALEDAGYKGGGGGDTMRFFHKPPIKLFIRGYTIIPYIYIRRWD